MQNFKTPVFVHNFKLVFCKMDSSLQSSAWVYSKTQITDCEAEAASSASSVFLEELLNINFSSSVPDVKHTCCASLRQLHTYVIKKQKSFAMVQCRQNLLITNMSYYCLLVSPHWFCKHAFIFQPFRFTVPTGRIKPMFSQLPLQLHWLETKAC